MVSRAGAEARSGRRRWQLNVMKCKSADPYKVMRDEKPHAREASMEHPQLHGPDEAQHATMPRALPRHCIDGE